ncbi:4-(cytidine 5'-diphospho)-2-C-methyl-D-erythritol kinase [Rhodobacteraceae bacterium 2376]|uniref:4-diphosphocytidyl-2-C-methyl-D-erythritol kinase n=1 Tax=Rhabdonatronobacter sediminivivens TaxID=2743469 RepID=A0A7Z0KVX5_9RHOB|nr:4-(cytidine 5'-diphospho)-2-C-methyl-D-erythritol kinase [Rhabdonatronobacter sediminivivens]NYS23782.1 4-(cytidine 5'-diphospho)-2-C-methyl-D-erythritol kinase [Rhabdonatronobacter sediminivivens]
MPRHLRTLAPAKINLTLHVTGQRADGYHLLDSLVVLLDFGDRVDAAEAGDLSLSVLGPYAADVPRGPDNLVLRAARLMGAGGVALTLHKHLPAASGIGGGSSDAAATLRAVAALTGAVLPDAGALARLGADVPVCLHGQPCRMQGVGEVLTAIPALPDLGVVLVNPGVGLSTPAVFAALARRDNPPMDPLPTGSAPWPDAQALADWLRGQRNDLSRPAIIHAPVIAEALAALEQMPGCLLARMSGSGATCFGLFPSRAAADHAAAALRPRAPGWWIAAGGLLPPGAEAPIPL